MKTKKHEAKPMSVDEAILQMNLVDHNFYVFVEESIGEVCVVYKRNDGGYGLITPEIE